MTTILSTNAVALFDADHDFIGYDIPDADPVSIDTKWTSKWDRDDALTYVVRWADGTFAEVFMLSNPRWNDVFHATAQRNHIEAGRKLAATLVGEAT